MGIGEIKRADMRAGRDECDSREQPAQLAGTYIRPTCSLWRWLSTIPTIELKRWHMAVFGPRQSDERCGRAKFGSVWKYGLWSRIDCTNHGEGLWGSAACLGDTGISDGWDATEVRHRTKALCVRLTEAIQTRGCSRYESSKYSCRPVLLLRTGMRVLVSTRGNAILTDC